MKLITLPLVGIFLITSVWLLIPATIPISPLGQSSPVESQQAGDHQSQNLVLGFLPYWNLNKVSDTALDTVTDLAYFALQMDEEGQIIKYQDPGWAGWRKFTADPRFTNKNITLAIQILEDSVIQKLLSKEESRRTAINTIRELSKDFNLTGINIDFEPSGAVSTQTKDSFTKFIEELTQTISKTPATQNLQLSVDIYPTIVGKQRLWDLPRLNPHVNYFVVMGYDYHYRGGDSAGPVAPLRGKDTYFNHDLISNLAELSALIPAQKTVLALPFYGYRWPTLTLQKYSRVTGRGVTTPLSEVDDYLSDPETTLYWDKDSLTPYLTFTKDGQNIQLYFENNTSLNYKIDLVKTNQYRGIAIWALGYEGDNHLLWQTIKDRL